MTVRQLRDLALGAALAGVVAAGLAAPSGAAAAPAKGKAQVAWKASSKTVKAGRSATIAVKTSGADRCQIQVAGRRRTVKLRDDAATVTFRFTTATRAKPGRYRVTVRCAGTQVTRTLKISRADRRAAHGKLTRRIVAGVIRVRVSAAKDSQGRQPARPAPTQPAPQPAPAPAPAQPAPAPQPVGPYSPEVTAQWEVWKPGIEADFLDGSGECTEYGYMKRPDIVERAERQRIADWINQGRPQPVPSLNWHAYKWADNARYGGMTVTTTPTVGAIMVDSVGANHVAYVEEVFDDGSFRVSEMNAPRRGVITERVIPASHIAGQGLQFIP
jgi:hypothetical protein